MQVGEIIGRIEIKGFWGDKKSLVSSLTDDSRKVTKNSLFIAIRGLTNDGHDFISQAVKNGASCIVGEREYKFVKNDLNNASYIKVSDSKNARGDIASLWFGTKNMKMKIIGITGTDGKTTTSVLIFNLLKSIGKKVALISTLGAEIDNKLIDTGYHVTNPECLDLHKMLSDFSKQGCEYTVLEVTSHGIEQKRIAGIRFDLAVLTNITREHLDYHKSFEAYKRIKINFLMGAKSIIINKDDSSFDEIIKCSKKNKIFSYSTKKDADYEAKDIVISANTKFMFVNKNKDTEILSNLPGEYNVDNLMAALSCFDVLGFDINKIKDSIPTFSLPEGRMQKIKNNLNFEIFVDFAHTPNALENVLKTLKGKTKGKLISVFGCAGERDKTKRRVMGEISGAIADYSVFTAEDPRSECIFNILKSMKMGARVSKAKELNFDEKIRRDENRYFFGVPERYEAIAFAINKIAHNGDCVVICGKGHEKSLAFGIHEHPWSDVKAVENIITSDKQVSAIMLCAGKGKRMHSKHPKVLSEIAGRPLISYTLTNLRNAKIGNIVAVVGFKKDEVIKRIWGDVSFAVQEKQLGTADAVSFGIKLVSNNCEDLIVLNGDDSAFYKPDTINDIYSIHRKSDSVLSFVSLIKENPVGLGRIIRDSKGKVLKIVEEKDASEKEKLVKEVNDGLYVFDTSWLKENLPRIKLSPQGEYYLVDLINIAVEDKRQINVYRLKDSSEWQGINTPEELSYANERMINILK